MTALYIQKDYIKIDCDRCGEECDLIKIKPDSVTNYDTVVIKRAYTICKDCI